jgi:hypothetical protein
MDREETTSTNATDKERADVIAFTKTPAFTKLVDSVVFEGSISPKLEPGEIKEGNSAQRRKAQRVKLQDVKEMTLGKRQRLEEQEASLADWENA